MKSKKSIKSFGLHLTQRSRRKQISVVHPACGAGHRRLNVAKVERDHKAEYGRRIARGAAKGITRSQARGHPKPTEAATSLKRPPRPIEDERLQLALKVLRQEKSLSAAAREAKISPERLRHYATEREHHRAAGPPMDRSATSCRAGCCSFPMAGPFRWWSATSRRRPRSDASCPP